ncbi:transposase IS481 family protein [Streptomyces sp. TLI_146]|nr:transposase IS481 family protein [Streptomyces sp. TLI_146]
MSHRNARLTLHGRRLLVQRVDSGRPVAHLAAEMGISRATGHKWVNQRRAEGEEGLHDQSGRPWTTPRALVDAPGHATARPCRTGFHRPRRIPTAYSTRLMEQAETGESAGRESGVVAPGTVLCGGFL